MKIFRILLLLVVFSMSYSSSTFAAFKSGYHVVSKTEDTVTIKSKKGEEITVKFDPTAFKVGDKVEYDAKKGEIKLFELPDGC